MEQKELLTVGLVGVGGVALLAFIVGQNKTTTASGVDPNAAATEAAIIGANTTAQNTGAATAVSLAGLAVDSQKVSDQTSVSMAQLADASAAAHDANQTTITLAAQNYKTSLGLGQLAANSTYESALLDTATKVQSSLAAAQTAQYTSYVNGQTALAADSAATTQTGLQTTALQAIAAITGQTQVDVAGIQGNTSTAVAGINAQAQTNIAQTNANAATQVSANQTTAAVNAADVSASASKSNGFWSALSNIAGSVAKAFIPSVAPTSVSGGGTQITDSMGVNNPTWGGSGSGAIAAAGG